VSAVPNLPSGGPFEILRDPEGLKERSVHASFAVVLSQGAKMIIQVSAQVILARMLFPSDFGVLAMVYPLIGFVQIFNDIGLGQAIIQRPTLVQDQVSGLFWINIALSCVLGCLMALMAPVTAWAYGEPRVHDVMLALCVMIPVSALGIHPTALLSRQMRFGWMALSDVTATFAGVVVTVFCAWQGGSYWSLVLGQFVTVVISNTVSWTLCGWRPSSPKLVRSVWGDLKFGGNLTGANLATFVTTSADNVVIGLMTGPVELGLYDRSYRLVVQPLGQMLAPISRVAIPLLSRLVDQPDVYRSAYLKMFRGILLLTVPIMLVCMTTGQVMIDLFLGSNWTDAAPIFSWICVGGLTAGIYSSTLWLFVSQDRTHEMRQFTTAASIINVASFIVGAFWGATGVAAVGALVFVLGTSPLMLYGATRSGPVHFRDLVRCGVPFAGKAAFVYAMLWVAERYIVLDSLGQIVVVTVLSYGGVVGLSLLSSGDRQFLRDAIRAAAILRKK
jgi:polysaccharide transporter, PST family